MQDLVTLKQAGYAYIINTVLWRVTSAFETFFRLEETVIAEDFGQHCQ
jgi:hypothetical protein